MVPTIDHCFGSAAPTADDPIILATHLVLGLNSDTAFGRGTSAFSSIYFRRILCEDEWLMCGCSHAPTSGSIPLLFECIGSEFLDWPTVAAPMAFLAEWKPVQFKGWFLKAEVKG